LGLRLESVQAAQWGINLNQILSVHIKHHEAAIAAGSCKQVSAREYIVCVASFLVRVTVRL
jgi:hypothetical protein